MCAGLLLAPSASVSGADVRSTDNAGSESSLKAQQDVGGQVWGSRLTADTLAGLAWRNFQVVTPGWQ